MSTTPLTLDASPTMITLQYRVNSRVDKGTSLKYDSPHIAEVTEETGQTSIELVDRVGKITINPFMYSITFPVHSFTEESLRDKYEASIAYLSDILVETPRKLRPAIAVRVNEELGAENPVTIFNENEDVIRGFFDTLFEAEGTKKIAGTNKYVQLRYTDVVVTL